MYTNIEAAKKLANTYKALTIKKLEKALEELSNGEDVMYEITGFGTVHTCTLCRSVDRDAYGFPMCKDCVWYSLFPYNDDVYLCVQDETYQNIKYAGGPYELKQALLDRAELLEEAIYEAEEENKIENENTGE